MHKTCIHVVQRSAVLGDPDIRLIVETQPVSVRIIYIQYFTFQVVDSGFSQ